MLNDVKDAQILTFKYFHYLCTTCVHTPVIHNIVITITMLAESDSNVYQHDRLMYYLEFWREK